MKNGNTATTWKTVPTCATPRIRPTTNEMRIGAPTRPRAGIQRGTSRARYNAVPSIKALNGAMLLPMTIAQFRTATSAAATGASDSPSAPAATCCRSVMTESRLMTLTVMIAPSNRRVAR